MHKFKTYRESIDIDYYVYFTKAYFAFNAYLKVKYPTLTDADKIKNIKSEALIRQKFSQLIYEGKHFKDDLSSLRDALSATVIINNNETVSFTKVKIGDHTVKVLFNSNYNGVAYNIRSIVGEKFVFKVKEEQSPSFVFEQLEEKLDIINITNTQKEKVREIINGHVSGYSINLSLEIDKLQELENLDPAEKEKLIENLYKGFIEILYKLRNGLFHSEVEPNSDVMKVYKFAYFLLRKILHKIPTT